MCLCYLEATPHTQLLLVSPEDWRPGVPLVLDRLKQMEDRNFDQSSASLLTFTEDRGTGDVCESPMGLRDGQEEGVMLGKLRERKLVLVRSVAAEKGRGGHV